MPSQYKGRDTGTEHYDITRAAALLDKWSGAMPLPAIGDRVNVTMNGLGTGNVEAYFRSSGGSAGWFAGVEVRLDRQPEWRVRQGSGDRNALVFGAELGSHEKI